MRTRAFRRAQRDRIQRKRRGYWGGHAASDRRTLGMVASTPQVCSGWCCGNPRHHFGGASWRLLTLQEKRAALADE